MAKNNDFQFILNKPTYKRRMQDVELVLMFCAFHNTNPDQYRKSLSQFLNDEMRANKKFSKEKLDLLEKQFKKSVKLIKHIWGNEAFNVYSIDEKTKGITCTRTFNQGLYQILMYWFIPYEYSDVISRSDLIREELLNLQIHNDEFRNTLTGSGTNSPKKVKIKFDIWGNTLKGILNYPNKQPRAFSYSLKQKLWDKDPTCQICFQRIRTIDDAEVDHIICYWNGGKTIPENARLTHRLCNRIRSSKTLNQSWDSP